MKILQVVPALEQGGVEWDALELAQSLSAAGVENGIASAGGSLVARLSDFGVMHHTLPLAGKNPFVLRANAVRLAKLVEQEGYDLVHVRSRAPAWSVKWAAEKGGFPWLSTFHGVYGTKPACFKLPYNRVMLAGRKTICVSEYVRRHVETTYAPTAGQLVTIRDGADTSRFYPEAVTRQDAAAFRRSLGFEVEAPLVVMVGRLTRWKGQHLLLEAIERLPRKKVGVLFVGSDQGRIEYSNELKSIAARFPHGKKTVFLERSDEMPLVYASGDVVVNASSGQPEAFGRVITEAQAMGRITIGTAHGGACETIQDGKTGFLVKPSDVLALAERLQQVLEMSENERQRVAEAAVESVRTSFSIERTCRQTLEVYRKIASHGEY